ncbi:MAG TPA: 50S ribosomal protein L29, partial [Polynucleobacter sp.]|nr:50S ribosomal protein L29 [Polynucleobacter sp.]
DHFRDSPLRLIGIEIMKNTELATKDLAALNTELTELLKTGFKLRMQKGTQQLTNTSQLGKNKRDIARVKTFIAQKTAQT